MPSRTASSNSFRVSGPRHFPFEPGVDLVLVFHVPVGKECRQGDFREDHHVATEAARLPHPGEQPFDHVCPGLGA